MLSRFRIRHKLLLANIGILVPALVFCSIATYAILKSTIEANIESELKNTTSAILNTVRTAASLAIRNHLRSAAESNRDIAAFYYDLSRQGRISTTEAKARAAQAMLSQRIGKTGYIYCMDSSGKIAVHPDEALKGADLSRHRFIRDQIQRRVGYLEYQWSPPGEFEFRNKALYMVYFEPWDWIISASSYRDEFRDLINIDDFGKDILTLRFGQTGYSYVIDMAGNLIIHPKLQGTNILDSRDADGRMFIQEMVRQKSGKIIYPWKNPGEASPREKLVIFNHIRELDWILASSSYLDEFYHPLKRLRRTVFTALGITLLLVLVVSYGIGATITGPLQGLMERFSAGASGDFTSRVQHRSGDEIGQLAEYFNTFMERLGIYQTDLKAEIEERREAQEALAVAHEELEERVRNRTRDLQAANTRLQEEMAERRHAETALRQQIKLVETVIQTIPNPVFYLDPQGRYLGSNTAFAEQVFGTSPERIIGRTLADLRGRSDDVTARACLRRDDELIRSPGKRVYEAKVCCADEVEREFLFSKATFTDDTGRAAGIVGIMMDLAPQRKAEKERLYHEKLSGVLEMAGAVCHELNQPLQAISGHAQLLAMALPSNHPAGGSMGKLSAQIERMAEITRKLMGISRYVTKHYIRGVQIVDIDKASSDPDAFETGADGALENQRIASAASRS